MMARSLKCFFILYTHALSFGKPDAGGKKPAADEDPITAILFCENPIKERKQKTKNEETLNILKYFILKRFSVAMVWLQKIFQRA